jgi:hypothetical protein
MTMIRDLVAQFFDTTFADGERRYVASMNDDDVEVEVLARAQ